MTAQNTTAVIAVHEVPAGVVAAQIDAVLSDLDVDVIKLGMLFSVSIQSISRKFVIRPKFTKAFIKASLMRINLIGCKNS